MEERRLKVPQKPPEGSGISIIRSEFLYEDWAEKFLWTYKEMSQPEILHELIAFLPCPVERESIDAVVAVASDPVSNRRRFFDPSQEMGERLSKAWGLPFVRGAFRRSPQPFSQKDLPRSLRQTVASRTISLQSDRLAGIRHVLLVDDLMTTGESLAAHGRLLRALDIEVRAWTLFRKL